MLWTAPALRLRTAIDWANPDRFKEVKTSNDDGVSGFEGIGEDRRRNADKVDPGIGRTRLGQRIFECVLSRLGPDPRMALWPAATPPHKQAGHMTAPDQCCSCVRKRTLASPKSRNGRYGTSVGITPA